MGLLERVREFGQAYKPEVKGYTLKARRDVQLLLEDQSPPEGEDYGPWMPQMTRLLQGFEQEGRGVFNSSLRGCCMRGPPGEGIAGGGRRREVWYLPPDEGVKK